MSVNTHLWDCEKQNPKYNLMAFIKKKKSTQLTVNENIAWHFLETPPPLKYSTVW